jgi:urea carboxylase
MQVSIFHQTHLMVEPLEHLPHPTLEILSPGQFTTVQDYPGRVGYWEVGVPPSGPMDHLSFRLGNRLLGNDEGAAGLECTLVGPTLRFTAATLFCLAGARMTATLDDRRIPNWKPTAAAAGSTLKLATVTGAGCRTYVLFRGGIDVPDYLGSRATFSLGRFGGHQGRALQSGDVLKLACTVCPEAPAPLKPLSPALVSPLVRRWRIGVLDGPHGAPDFFTDDDIATFFATDWEVHNQSARTGVRLVGPKPRWARTDGGEAGLHPSNIHDTAYAVGAVDFTGDMPVILGPDGPSLGGFVCPATIVQAELWKIGQLRTGDTVRFVPMSPAQARAAELEQNTAVWSLHRPAAVKLAPIAERERVRPRRLPAADARPAVTYRRAGDRYLLVEYGPMTLDLALRARVHALYEHLRAQPSPGILDLTPGIRSLQVHFDSCALTGDRLIERLERAEVELPPTDQLEVASRIVHLPLSWDDEATRKAIGIYTSQVRPDAPWCPSNIEFIRRVNGLDSIDDVYRIVFEASYLVLGLGDVYLGAPVATPIDPRHRLVTTKYNPARTWTPENAVGIGGAYLCVYGMEGPGGYQFVGRTVPMWNRERTTEHFEPGRPWLLRFFDQIRFFPVSHEELMDWRAGLIAGTKRLDIEPATFRLAEYQAFLASIEPQARAFKARQQAAFDAERARWAAAGEFARDDASETDPRDEPRECVEEAAL